MNAPLQTCALEILSWTQTSILYPNESFQSWVYWQWHSTNIRPYSLIFYFLAWIFFFFFQRPLDIKTFPCYVYISRKEQTWCSYKTMVNFKCNCKCIYLFISHVKHHFDMTQLISYFLNSSSSARSSSVVIDISIIHYIVIIVVIFMCAASLFVKDRC